MISKETVVLDYQASGVDISEANKLVHWLKRRLAKNTPSLPQGVAGNIGAYGGLFRAQFPAMKNPYLVASTDGVGTKLKLAEHFQSYKSIGIDLVAMCVNDLICQGAKPLFFLDYYACEKLQQKPAREFLEGVISACHKSECLLLGGETAEMPGCYTKSQFDCAGFALGVVDRSKILGAHKVRKGDCLIGVSSTGFHSNGFSLLRKVFQKDLHRWKKELLQPTALYVPLAQELFRIPGLRAIAHITGGGIRNILRILPEGTKASLKDWSIPSLFLEVQKRARISKTSLLNTFNSGVGLVVVASPSSSSKICRTITKHRFSAIDLGTVQASRSKKPTLTRSSHQGISIVE